MSVLIKWAKKRYLPETDEEPEAKKIKVEETTEAKSAEEKTEDKEDTEKTKEEDVKSKDEEKKDDEKKTDEKKEVEKVKEEKPNLIPSLQPFIKYIHWDHGDADFFLEEVHNNSIMTEEDENVAMGEMLKSYVERKPTAQAKPQVAQITRRTPATPASRRGGRQAPERGPSSGPDLAVVGGKQSKNPGSGGVIVVQKTDDDMVLS